jgi:hypothetical protein
MLARRALAAAATCFAAGALVAYLLVAQTSATAPSFAYDQQTFATSRAVDVRGFRLHTLKFRPTAKFVEVDWYDSAFGLIGSPAGAYVSLYIDGRLTASSLRGSLDGLREKSSATLRWAGRLPSGTHTFTIRLDRVDEGVLAPFVPPAGVGIDSLSITQ